MDPEDDKPTADEVAGQAAFDSGFEKQSEQPEKKPAETPRAAEPADKPDYVQIPAKEWAEVRAAAARTASYDNQFAKLFGTTGNIQKLLNEQRAAAPRDMKVEMPSTAFAKMAKDFPELAELNREELQNALSQLRASGQPAPDEATIKRIMEEQVVVREIEALEDAYPAWREIVGAVDTKDQQPDPNNPYRRWLATKDASYQTRINGTMSAAVIGRSIRLFQSETKAPAKPTMPSRDSNARDAVIRGAVQPKGDGGAPSSSNAREDAFAAGFGR